MRLSLALFAATILSPQRTATADLPSLLHRFEAAYRSSHTLRADFLEQYSEGGKDVRAEAGVAYFSKPGKMRWEYVSPEANLYLVDGKWTWFYVPADHTVIRTRTKESADSRTPFALLAGEMKVSRICKRVDFDASTKPVTPNGVVLRCLLRSGAGSPDSSALFELNPASGELLRVLLIDPGGVQVDFRFSNWQFDAHVEPAKFEFQASKGVAIVDGDLSEPGVPSRQPEQH